MVLSAAAQDAEACRQLLEVLVAGNDSLAVVRGLLLARDCGPCLSMPGVSEHLADRLASDQGVLHDSDARHSSDSIFPAADARAQDLSVVGVSDCLMPDVRRREI